MALKFIFTNACLPDDRNHEISFAIAERVTELSGGVVPAMGYWLAPDRKTPGSHWDRYVQQAQYEALRALDLPPGVAKKSRLKVECVL